MSLVISGNGDMWTSGTVHPDLYILRHGETTWNAAGRFQGRMDAPLTAAGRRHADRQRALLVENGIEVGTVFSSPQGRALQTARLIFGHEAPIQTDDRLQEIHFGAWEGLTRDEVHARPGGRGDTGSWNFRSPGGETFEQISERVRGFLDNLTGPAVLVTHGTTSLVLRGLCLALSESELLALPKDHGCIYVVSNGRHSILR